MEPFFLGLLLVQLRQDSLGGLVLTILFFRLLLFLLEGDIGALAFLIWKVIKVQVSMQKVAGGEGVPAHSAAFVVCRLISRPRR